MNHRPADSAVPLALLRRFLPLCCLALSLTGCLGTEPPRFRLNFEGKDRSEVTKEQQQALVDSLYALFGTPDEPFVLPESGLNIKKLQMAAGSAARESGSIDRHGLYRQHCAHCHGTTGDGAGPTALFVRPYPRDYRSGKFKFTSTGAGILATSADLRKTIVDGINGTAMPSFALLPADEIDALTEYVKYLSIRGQTEFYISQLIEGGETLPLAREQLVNDALQIAVDLWKEAEGEGIEVIPPLRFDELADVDGDGNLTRAEVAKWLEDNFAKIDVNGDGFIDADEQVQPVVMSDPPITAVKDQDGKIVKVSGDTDGDMKVSQQEMNDFVLGYFDQADTGSLLKDLADANHDGQLSREEASDWIATNFSKFDTSGDGTINATERGQVALLNAPPFSIATDAEGKRLAFPGDADGDQKVSQQELTDFVLGFVDDKGTFKDKSLSQVERLASSILAGKQLFAGAGGCVKCHGPTALGDNEEPIYDDWNTPKFNKSKEEMARLAKLFTLPIQELKPRNLRLGIYRGGRRPVDLYRRLHAGIKGTPMPALGPSGANPAKFKSEEIWHLVDFVRSLPYDPISQPYKQASMQRDRN